MTDATLRLTQPDHIGAADIDRINRLPVAERVAAIRAHQSEHWRTGRSIAAEVYFDAFEFLSDDASDALVIIGGEMGLRAEAGEGLDPTEYVRRFPKFAAELPVLYHLQRELCNAPNGPAPAGPNVPGFDILGELGHGSSGVVYRARQVNLDRPVALKVLLRGGMAGSSAITRFRSEAHATARLRHPNIVQVFDVGEALTPSGHKVPYIALELIEGPTLAQWCRGRAIPPGDAAALVHQLADAMDAAHRVGVVHRDVKPANILLASGASNGPVSSTPGALLPPLAKITDFGLAKLLDGTGEQTATGTILGTPAYMAPEQAGARRDAIGPAVDIYSLGAVFYELLTGLPPFRGDGVAEVIHQVCHNEPVAPARLRPSVPRDLETVCLKCLEKEPARRYPTAAALADDLQAFLEGRPVQARPLGLAGVGWRWCRRYPAVSGLAAAVAALLLAIAFVASAAAIKLNVALTTTRQAEHQTSAQLLASYIAQADANRLSHRPGHRFETLRLLAEARRLADAIGDGGAHDQTIRDLAAAALSLPDLAPGPKWTSRLPAGTGFVDVDAAWSVYARTAGDGSWTVRRLADDAELAAGPAAAAPASTVPSLSPDGRFLALRSLMRSELWSVADGPPRRLVDLPFGYSLQFRPDSRLFAASQSGGRVQIYDLPTGDRIAEFRTAATREVVVAMHPTEPWVATCSYYSREVVVYDWRAGVERWRAEMPASTFAAAWSPDGRWLAVSCDAGAIYVFAAESPVPNRRIPAETGGLRLAFLAGSDQLAGWDWAAKWSVWDVATGRQLAHATGNVLSDVFNAGRLPQRLGPTRDGGEMAAFRFADGRECQTLPVTRLAPTELKQLAVHPNGRLLAAGSQNGIALWDLATGEELPPLAAGFTTGDVQFTADGALLATGRFGSFRWPVAIGARNTVTMTIGPPERFCDALANSVTTTAGGSIHAGASRSITTFQPDAGLWLWRIGGPVRGRRLLAGQDCWWCRLSSDGRWLTWQNLGNEQASFADVTTGRQVPVIRAGPLGYRSLDGRHLFVPGTPFMVRDLDLPAATIPAALESVIATPGVVFSRDGRLLAYPVQGGALQLCDASNGKKILRLETLEPLQAPTFSPDGRRLLAITGGRSVAVWDLGLLFERLRELGLDRGDPPLPAIAPAESLSMHRTLRIATPGAWRLRTELADLADLPGVYFASSPDGLRRSGHILKRLGSRDESAARFAALRRLIPGDAEAAYELGLDALNRQHPAAADQLFAAAAADPQLRDIAELLRAALAKRCVPDASAARALAGEGFYFFNRDDWGAAVACLDEAVRLDPTNSLALRLLSRLRVCGPAPWRDPEQALALAHRAIAADPSFTTPRTTVGIALLRLGRLAEARQALAEAAAAGEAGQQGFNWYYLAMTATTAGDHAAAADYFRKAEEWWAGAASEGGWLPRCLRSELAAARFEVRAALTPPRD